MKVVGARFVDLITLGSTLPESARTTANALIMLTCIVEEAGSKNEDCQLESERLFKRMDSDETRSGRMNVC
jgi:hypothetical protein